MKTNETKKNYQVGIDYPIELVRLSKENGDGFSACIPKLGRYAFVGWGETPNEAVADLQHITNYLSNKKLSLDKKSNNEFSIRQEISKNPDIIKKLSEIMEQGGGVLEIKGHWFILKKTGIATQAI